VKIRSFIVDTLAAVSFTIPAGTLALLVFAPSVVLHESTYIGWMIAVAVQMVTTGRVYGKYLNFLRRKLNRKGEQQDGPK
jgi:hypothetical protein